MIRISNYPARTPTDSGNAAEFRRWADDCATQAADPRASGDERAYLLTKRHSLMALAATEDWLNGDAPPRRDH
jgi:hypothetical protein